MPRALTALLLGLVLLAPDALAQTGPPVKPGFPLVFNESPTNEVSPIGSHVLAVDLGLAANLKELVFGLRNGDLYVVQCNGNCGNAGATWGTAPGWPQALPSHIYSSPAVADFHGGNAGPEIAVGYGSTFENSDGDGPGHGGLRAYGRTGNLLWDVQTGDTTPGPADGFRDPVMGTPAIGDVNGDGQFDVVFGALDHYLYVVNGSTGESICSPLFAGAPAEACRHMEDTVFSSAALHDLNGDGRMEVIIGGDRFSINGGRLSVLTWNGSTLTEFPGFPKDFPNQQVISSSPVVGDIDGDGQPEIVHGTGHFYDNGPEQVFAWNCDGTAVAGWPVTTDGEVLSSPALANIDGDALPEVLITTSSFGASDGNSRLYAFNGNGSQVFAPVVVRDFFGQSLNAGEPIVADVLGADSTPEILVTTNGEVAVFTNTGARLTEIDNFPDDPPTSIKTEDSLTAVTVTDLETNGAGSMIEVIAVSGDCNPGCGPVNFDRVKTVVHVWNPVGRATAPLWGAFRQGERRLGVVPGAPGCQSLGACSPPAGTALDFFTLTPCRIIDTRNPAGPFGGPALSNGAPRTFDLTGQCGIPGTAVAVSLNVTVTGPTGGGHITFSPGCLPGATSTINFGAGQTRANNTVQPISALDELTATAFIGGGGAVHLIIDVNGYFQ